MTGTDEPFGANEWTAYDPDCIQRARRLFGQGDLDMEIDPAAFLASNEKAKLAVSTDPLDGNSAAVRILRSTASTIGTVKRDVHGRPERAFDTIAEFWNVYLEGLRLRAGTDTVTIHPVDVANMMELFKLARQLHGDPAHQDHYIDRIGYAALAWELVSAEREAGL